MKTHGEGSKQPEVGRRVYRDPNLRVLFAVTLMAVLGVSSITPAFPRIAEALRVTPQHIGLLITIFTLPGFLLTPVLGVLADRFGRKRILVPSLLLFGLAGGACTFARDFDLLLALRFIQGVGAASLGSLNVTIIGDLYSGKDRTAAMGYNTTVLSVGTASYPAIGGALALLGWYLPFLLALAAIPVGLLVLFALDNPEPERGQRLQEYLREVWQSARGSGVLGLFVTSLVTFLLLYGAYLTFFPILLGSAFGFSPLVIGLILSSASLATGLASFQLGRLARAFSERTLIRGAFLLYALALVSIPFVPSLWVFLIPSLLFGAAMGINTPSLVSLLTELAPMKHRAAIMSLNGMALRLGQTLGPVVMGVVFALWGMDGVFYAGGGLSVGMFLAALVLIR